MSALGQKQTFALQKAVQQLMSAMGQQRTCSESQKVMLVASLCLPRGRERLHSAVRNRLGSARGGKKFDQSFRTFNVA